MEYIATGTYIGVAGVIGDAIAPHILIVEDGRIDLQYDFLHIIIVHITTSIHDEGGDDEVTQTYLVVVNGYIAVLLVSLQFGPVLIGVGVNVHGYHQTLDVIDDGVIDFERAMIKVDAPH